MRDNDPLQRPVGEQVPGREVSEGIVGYLLDAQHGPAYRWVCVGLALGAAAIMGSVLVGAVPVHHPIVYRYQWPGQFGDQRMTICTASAENHAECPRAYTSSEL